MSILSLNSQGKSCQSILLGIGVWNELHPTIPFLFPRVIASTAIGISGVKVDLASLGVGFDGLLDLLIVTSTAYVLVSSGSNLLQPEHERVSSPKELENLLNIEEKLHDDGIRATKCADRHEACDLLPII
jgi:hypothetical protein